MKPDKFQFLALLVFGLLVISTALFLSGSNFPTTMAISNVGEGVSYMLVFGISALALIALYIRFRVGKSPE